MPWAAAPTLVIQAWSLCSLPAAILGEGSADGQAAGRWAEPGPEAGPPVAFPGRAGGGAGVGAAWQVGQGKGLCAQHPSHPLVLSAIPASLWLFWAPFSGCLGRLAGALFDMESKLL